MLDKFVLLDNEKILKIEKINGNFYLHKLTIQISNKPTHIITLVIVKKLGVKGGTAFLLTVDELVNTLKNVNLVTIWESR